MLYARVYRDAPVQVVAVAPRVAVQVLLVVAGGGVEGGGAHDRRGDVLRGVVQLHARGQRLLQLVLHLRRNFFLSIDALNRVTQSTAT